MKLEGILSLNLSSINPEKALINKYMVVWDRYSSMANHLVEGRIAYMSVTP